MSKSKNNVVSPASLVERYGADTARTYILFIGPADQDADWSDSGVEGVFRFLSRLWRIASETAAAGDGVAAALPEGPAGADLDLLRKAHWAIDKVTTDNERFAFHTAIAAVMELINACYALRGQASAPVLRFAVATAASLVFPFAPHAGADAYELLTGQRVWERPWPVADARYLQRDVVEVVCQVNGKLRDRVQAAAGTDAEQLKQLCRAAPKVSAHIDGHEVVKEIVVPDKLVNFVVR
jgi:leucyl-tRNA synthetase